MENNDTKFKGMLDQILRPENLALLAKSDRLVILAGGLIVMGSLGAVTALRQHPTIGLVLSLTSIVIVAGLVVLVQWRALSFGGLEADLHAQADAAQAINGDWWQIVRTEDHPGLTYVVISISEVAERHAMQGISFSEDGQPTARFSSDVIAVRTTTPVELYYFWRGTEYGNEKAEIVSGLGRFRFDSVGRERKPMEAEGAFTRGTREELVFADARPVELVRLSEKESQRLAEDSSPACMRELARDAFKRFELKPGRTFSET